MKYKNLAIISSLLVISVLIIFIFLYKSLVTLVVSNEVSNIASDDVTNSGFIVKTNDHFFLTNQIFFNQFLTKKKRVIIRVFNSIPNQNQHTTYGKTKLSPDGDFAFSYSYKEEDKIQVVDLYLNTTEFEKMDQITKDKYVTFAIVTAAVESQMLLDNDFDTKQRKFREDLLSNLAEREKMPVSLLLLN